MTPFTNDWIELSKIKLEQGFLNLRHPTRKRKWSIMTPNAAFVANNKSIKYRPRKIPTFKVGERSQIYQISFLYLSGRDDPDSLPPTKNRAMNELNKVRTIQDIIIIIVIIIVGVVAYIFFLKKSCSSFPTPVTCT